MGLNDDPISAAWNRAEHEYNRRIEAMGTIYADYHDPDGCGLRQRELIVTQVYDRAYLDARYWAIDDRVQDLARRRAEILTAFCPDRGRLLDFGCGTGHVVRQARLLRWFAWGHDLTRYSDDFTFLGEWRIGGPWDVVTFFDSLEHLPDPAGVVRQLGAPAVMVSVPWCHYPDRPDWFMAWKHRRPGEHLWHWSRETLDRFFARLGYRAVMWSSFEDGWRANPEQAEPNILTAIYRR